MRRTFARTRGQTPLHLVTAWLAERGVQLGQLATEAKSNEIAAIPALLDMLDVRGATVTIDAAGCQTKIVEKIVEKGADYLLALEGNQPLFYDELILYFEHARQDRTVDARPLASHETVDKEHGRLEVRRTFCSDDLDWMTDRARWKGLRSIAMIERERTIRGETSVEKAYYITSHAPDTVAHRRSQLRQEPGAASQAGSARARAVRPAQEHQDEAAPRRLGQRLTVHCPRCRYHVAPCRLLFEMAAPWVGCAAPAHLGLPVDGPFPRPKRAVDSPAEPAGASPGDEADACLPTCRMMRRPCTLAPQRFEKHGNGVGSWAGTWSVPAMPAMSPLHSPPAPSDPRLAGLDCIADKYEIIQLIGEGGMGAVYEARNVVTHKRVAIKVLVSAELASHPDIVERFFREARASSIVESDHIVQVFDSGADPRRGLPYMVMEYLQGEDLEQLMQRVGAVNPLAAAKLVLQASQGLARAHEQGIVHRDIKPANLYLSQRDSGELLVKLLDFGIAKVRVEAMHAGRQGLTATGSLLGTPLYMSPEQIKSASKVDASSDVWSLGMVLFQLLSGTLPYPKVDSIGELMACILTTELTLLQDLAPWVPPELAEITHRAISRDRARRYADAAQLRDALNEIVPGGPSLSLDQLRPVDDATRAFRAPRLKLTDDGMLRATTRTGLEVTTHGGTRGRKSKAGMLAGAAAAVLVAVIAGGVALTQRAGAPAAAEVPAAEVTTVVVERHSAAVIPELAPTPFVLKIAPADAKVRVAGLEASVADGGVIVSGRPGDVVQVELSIGNRRLERKIAVTSDGLMPARLELDATPVAQASPAATPTGQPAKPTAESAKLPAAPAPAIDTSEYE